MPTTPDLAIPHNSSHLGEPLRNRKKRGAVFLVIVASIAFHVLGLGIFGIIKIVETIAPPPEFEAPPVVQVDTPPPPPPPPPTTKRTQKSLPRPQPLAAQNPQNLSVPAIVMEESDMAFGRGFGGGLGELGGGILDRVDISFFGVSGGSNIVVILDRTGSGSGVFGKTRAELLRTIDQMRGSSAQLAVIYFGGSQAGMRGLNKAGIDPTKVDYWWPKGVTPNSWLTPDSGGVETLVRNLKAVDLKREGRVTRDPRERERGQADFVLGTQFWGAINSAYQLDPPPDTIYFMVEPNVAFPNLNTVRSSYAVFDKFGVAKPKNTRVVFIIGNARNNVKDMNALKQMVKFINGGKLSPQEINKLIVFTK